MKNKLTLLLYFFSISTFCQEYQGNPEIVSNAIEHLITYMEEPGNLEQLHEDFQELSTNPLNLNTASREELEQIHVLNDFQIHSLIEYREKHGKLVSLQELQLVYGFDRELIEGLAPFVSLSGQEKHPAINWKTFAKRGKGKVYLRAGLPSVENHARYFSFSPTDSSHEGNRLKLYSKYRYQLDRLVYAGITADKDPGEAFFAKSNPRGFDFYSAYVQLNKLGPVKKLVAGDYSLSFGQGLVLWSGFGFGKSPYVLNINKGATGIRRSSSSNENMYFRGLATTIEKENFEISVFASRKNRDANISQQDNITGKVLAVSSIQNSGYHRDENEIFDEDALGEFSWGTNLQYNRKKLSAGFTFFNTRYDALIEPSGRLYTQFKTIPRNGYLGSIHYSYRLKDWLFFGEAAMGQENSLAVVDGALFKVSSRLSLAALYRSYPRNYYAPYGNSFAENSSVNNEKGFYLGSQFFPFKRWEMNMYFDAYQFPWLRHNASVPMSGGIDYFMKIAYQPTKTTSMYWYLKNERKDENYKPPGEQAIQIAKAHRQQYRFHIQYELSPVWKCKNRVEIKRYFQAEEQPKSGMIVYQDLQYAPGTLPWLLTLRFAMFDAPVYNTRVYAYEHDVLHAFSVPFFYGEGIRAYVNTRYKFGRRFSCWLKLAHTFYRQKGQDNILSNLNQPEINFQLIVSL
jgi:hypothetical protein